VKQLKEETIYGVHAVESALYNDAGNVVAAWLEPSKQDKRLEKIIELLKQNDISFDFVDKKTIEKKAKSSRHQGVAIRYKTPDLYTEKELDQYKDQAFYT